MMKNTIATLLVIVVLGTFSTATIIQSAQAYIDPTTELAKPKAPMALHLKMATTSMLYGGLTGQETGK